MSALKNIFILGFLFFVVAFLLCSCAAYFEAKTFNECTKSNATWWDAMNTDLRVLECHK